MQPNIPPAGPQPCKIAAPYICALCDKQTEDIFGGDFHYLYPDDGPSIGPFFICHHCALTTVAAAIQQRRIA